MMSCLLLLAQYACRALSAAFFSAGSSSDASIAMIAMTTNNSMRVKAVAFTLIELMVRLRRPCASFVKIWPHIRFERHVFGVVIDMRMISSFSRFSYPLNRSQNHKQFVRWSFPPRRRPFGRHAVLLISPSKCFPACCRRVVW